MKQALSLVALLSLVACGGSDKSVNEPGESSADDEDPFAEARGRSGDRRSRFPGDDEDENEDENPNLAVRGLKGRLDQYDIEAGIKPKAGAFSSCYHKNARKKGYLAGQIKMRFVVHPTGEVKSVAMEESDLGAWEIETCLLDVARSIKFARPKGGEANFEIPLQFSGKRQALWWGEDQADQEVADKLVELVACENPPDDVWITFYIGARGKVLSVGFASKEKTPIGAEWADCAVSTITAWTLSDPRGKVAKASFRFNAE